MSRVENMLQCENIIVKVCAVSALHSVLGNILLINILCTSIGHSIAAFCVQIKKKKRANKTPNMFIVVKSCNIK